MTTPTNLIASALIGALITVLIYRRRREYWWHRGFCARYHQGQMRNYHGRWTKPGTS